MSRSAVTASGCLACACFSGDGHRDGIRHLRARAAWGQRDGDVVPDRQRDQAATAAKARRARWDFDRISPAPDARAAST